MNRFYGDLKKYWKYSIYAAKADLKSEVTNSYLDWFWWILEPLCNMFIYYVIFGLVFKMQEKYFLVFIFSALTMWTFFSRCCLTSVSLMRNNEAIITRIYVPKHVFLFQKMFVNAFKMLICCGIIVVLMALYHVPVDIRIVGIIPSLAVFFLFTFGFSCILMHYGVFTEDLSYIVSILLDMLFFFTGIFYSISNRFPAPYGGILEKINPVAFFIASVRNALLYRTEIPYIPLLIWFIVSALLSAIGIQLIYKNENSYVKVI